MCNKVNNNHGKSSKCKHHKHSESKDNKDSKCKHHKHSECKHHKHSGCNDNKNNSIFNNNNSNTSETESSGTQNNGGSCNSNLLDLFNNLCNSNNSNQDSQSDNSINSNNSNQDSQSDNSINSNNSNQDSQSDNSINSNDSNQNQNSQSDDQVAQDTLKQVNNLRAQHGLKPVKLNASLGKSAKKQSEYMNKNHKMSHTGDNKSNPDQRMKQAGFKGNKWEENVAQGQGSVKQVMNSWIKSPEHLKNMLDPNVTQLGISKQGNSWTMDLGA